MYRRETYRKGGCSPQGSSPPCGPLASEQKALMMAQTITGRQPRNDACHEPRRSECR